MKIATGRFEITLDTGGDSLFSYRGQSTARGTVAVTAPRFEIEGQWSWRPSASGNRSEIRESSAD